MASKHLHRLRLRKCLFASVWQTRKRSCIGFLQKPTPIKKKLIIADAKIMFLVADASFAIIYLQGKLIVFFDFENLATKSITT